MTYEMKIVRQEKEMLREIGKKKSIALKVQEERVIDETKINDMEEDISLITMRVQNLMMKDKFSGRTYNRRSNKKEGPSRDFLLFSSQWWLPFPYSTEQCTLPP